MNFWKALTLGAAVGFAVALVPSCGNSNCTAANCAGCCDPTTNKCVPVAQENATKCGAAGKACAACTTGQTCNSGVCTGGCTGSNCNASCNATNCPQGCCTSGANSLCISGAAQGATNCGSGGATCQPCNGSCVQGTIGGSCVVDAGTAVGGPCTQDSDCSSVGAGAICKHTVTSGPDIYFGGFCTLDCSSMTAMCPSGSTCVGLGASGFFGETQTLCWPNCSAPTFACREPGYGCYGLTDSTGMSVGDACWIDPPDSPGVVGRPCGLDFADGGSDPQLSGNRDCQTSNGPGAPFCFTPWLPDGGLAGNPNGSCSAICDGYFQGGQALANFYCSGNDAGTAVCLPIPLANGGTAHLCQQSCSGDAGQDWCHPGWVCNPLPPVNAARFLVNGICFPDCRLTDAGVSCPTGQSCSPDAGICM